MRLNKLVQTFIILLLSLSSQAQMDPVWKDYYQFPIKPGIRNTLAGTMGELRSTHFHTGIDIRTGGVQGVPVQAAADGYVSRISISPSGYGNALYIMHGNGQTTVYAHLKTFADDIAQYAMEQQYKKESFRVNLFPGKDQFIVKKGEIIALSGNSGSSGGPHLHFDVRNGQPAVLNPLSFNFEEIVDTRSPEVRKIAFKTVGIDSRINNQFGRFEFDVKKEEGIYVIETPLKIKGTIGVELYAFDRQDWTRFRTGINTIIMKVDDVLVFEQNIDEIPFSKSRNFYNHINYKELKDHGYRYHKLYVDTGNELEFYKTNDESGLVTIKNNDPHELQINMFDTYGNSSEVRVSIKGSDSTNFLTPSPKGSSHEILGNVLTVYSQKDSLEYAAQFHFADIRKYLMPSYSVDGYNVYLWNLLDGIPDSVTMRGASEQIPVNAMIPSHQAYSHYSPFMEAHFTKRTLFDSVYLQFSYSEVQQLEIFRLGQPDYPLRSSVEVLLFPKNNYNKDKTSVYSMDEAGNFRFSGGKWEGNNIRFKTNSFSRYTLISDSIPPNLKPLIINEEELVFRINDNLSGIKKINVSINDKWVLMNYDPKRRQIWSSKLLDEQFKGQLKVLIVDNNNNERYYETTIK